MVNRIVFSVLDQIYGNKYSLLGFLGVSVYKIVETTARVLSVWTKAPTSLPSLVIGILINNPF